MVIVNLKNFTSFFSVLLLANVSFMYAAEDIISDDEMASLVRRAEIAAHNEPLKASDMAKVNPTDLHINADKLNRSALRAMYLNKHKSVLPDCHARLASILTEINSRRFDENVHALDTHVVANLDNLLNIARTLDMGRNVPLKDALTIVRGFNIVSNQHLNILCDGFDARHIELFSRVATLSSSLYLNMESDIGVNQFVTITDNWTTNGGCFQGRRNRLYIVLASIMANIGV